MTSIGYDAFNHCTNLTNVYYDGTIEDWCNITFRNIYSNPMSYATHFYIKNNKDEYEEVTEIEIPDTILEISNYRFLNFTAVEKITIHNAITKIGKEAFENCKNLKYNEYGNGYYLGNDDNPYLIFIKMKDTSLTSVKIHTDTYIIDFFGFLNCNNLENVYYDGSIEDWCNIKFSSVYSYPFYYASHFFIKNDKNEYNEVGNIKNLNYLSLSNINYTYLPQYMTEEHVKELLTNNKKLAEAGQKDSSGNTIPDIQDAVTLYEEARKNNDVENMNKYKDGWYAYYKWLETWYQYSSIDSVEGKEKGFAFYEFKASTFEFMSDICIKNLYKWLYDWCGYTLDDLKEDNDQFNVTNEFMSEIIINYK